MSRRDPSGGVRQRPVLSPESGSSACSARVIPAMTSPWRPCCGTSARPTPRSPWTPCPGVGAAPVAVRPRCHPAVLVPAVRGSGIRRDRTLPQGTGEGSRRGPDRLMGTAARCCVRPGRRCPRGHSSHQALGFPYTLFVLSASGKLFRTKVAFVSVGANDIRQRATRSLSNWTARMAFYRSYRGQLLAGRDAAARHRHVRGPCLSRPRVRHAHPAL